MKNSENERFQLLPGPKRVSREGRDQSERRLQQLDQLPAGVGFDQSSAERRDRLQPDRRSGARHHLDQVRDLPFARAAPAAVASISVLGGELSGARPYPAIAHEAEARCSSHASRRSYCLWEPRRRPPSSGRRYGPRRRTGPKPAPLRFGTSHRSRPDHFPLRVNCDHGHGARRCDVLSFSPREKPL